jgi:ribosomal protein S11
MKTNWLQPGLNNFRQNKQPGAEFSASDAVATLERACETGQLRINVRNLGEAPLPPGIPVDVMKGPTLLATVTTTRVLGPAQGELLLVTVTDPQVLMGMANVHVVVRPPASVRECRPGNNASAPISLSCIN